MIVEGRVWVVGDDISTDLLYPQVAYTMPLEEAARMVFRANRPGWSDLVEPGDLIVGGRSFGIGSSRPAVALLRELGIAGTFAESFSNLYFRNCVNFALPALAIPGILSIVEEGDRIRVDLAAGTAENLRTGARVAGPPLPPELLAIVEQGGVMAALEAQGYLAPE